jgi:pimeloyl-ACP methyl ester carboxylesterase
MVGHRNVAAGDLRLHVADEGEGPLALLLHGFPECWYTWRHQLAPRFPGMDELIPALPKLHPTVGDAVILPGCGHWIGEERPAEVNAELLTFLGALT